VAWFEELSEHFHGGTDKNHETSSQDSRSLSRDFNLGPPEYETEVLNTQPQYSVSKT
jgi:hypothetical protein